MPGAVRLPVAAALRPPDGHEPAYTAQWAGNLGSGRSTLTLTGTVLTGFSGRMTSTLVAWTVPAGPGMGWGSTSRICGRV
jgi:hypothetical protein